MDRIALYLLRYVSIIAVLVAGSGGGVSAAPAGQSAEQPKKMYEIEAGSNIVPEAPGLGEIIPQEPVAPRAEMEGLVFQSFRDGNWEIYARFGYAAPQRLTANAVTDIYPRFNRGCSRIAYASYRNHDFEIVTINPDGSGETILTRTNTDEWSPAWSPDGSRIVYVTGSGEKAEIWVMNADGSGQTQLTFGGDYDGMPAWSPDGSKIAFISRRTGGYRVYTMNLDGSGAIQISTQPYSAHPVWSPDGNYIAYDADNNGDGWQELMKMRSDGSSPQQLYNPQNGSVDAWAGSWSALGDLINFTEIVWIQGGWYKAYLKIFFVQNGNINSLVSGEREWNPDTQTADVVKPVSNMTLLPSISSAPFRVTWTGSDSGIGIGFYNVQVRDGAGGGWIDWFTQTQETQAIFPGNGGHTYSFRIRAIDKHYNTEDWPVDPDTSTKVEDSPPISAILPLEGTLRNGSRVFWAGRDPGGSGIARYDVQYRDGADAWVNWLAGTGDTSAIFEGIPGHTYSFRVRGTDRALNIEDWPPGNGDTSALLYSWGVTGTVVDNAGAPVSAASITTTPAAATSSPSDVFGRYWAYAAASSANYSVVWEKAGYGVLPPTAYSVTQDAHVEVVLPPASDFMRNGGFEGNSLDPDWSAAGSPAPALSDQPHSGGNSLLMGPIPQAGFGPVMTITTSADEYAEYQAAATPDGSIHVIWSDGGKVMYSRRESDGRWTQPADISQTYGNAKSLQLAVEPDGTLHAAWDSRGRVCWAYLDPGSTNWAAPVVIYDQQVDATFVRMAVDTKGGVHLLWFVGSTFGHKYHPHGGNWSALYTRYIGFYDFSQDTQLLFDETDRLHVRSGKDYMRRSPDGTWIDRERPLERWFDVFDMQMGVDRRGAVSLIFRYGERVYMMNRPLEGGWSEAQPFTNQYSYYPRFVVAPDGTQHVLLRYNELYGEIKVIHMLRQPSASGWTTIPTDINEWAVEKGKLYLTRDGTLHLVVASASVGYWKLIPGGAWQEVLPPDMYISYRPVEFVLDVFGDVHLITQIEFNPGIYSTGPTSAVESGNWQVSQVVTVPITATAPALSFLYNLAGRPSTTGSQFEVSVEGNGADTTVFASTQTGLGWKHGWADLGSFAGQTITVTFQSAQESGCYLHPLYLDDITLGQAHPDLWVVVDMDNAQALPGETVISTITYGNQGGAPAPGVSLSSLLPAGLSFVEASLPPTVNGQILTWNVGDLPAKSGPFTITVTAVVNANTARGTSLAMVASLAPAGDELETANNQAQVEVFVGARVFIPLIPKE